MVTRLKLAVVGSDLPQYELARRCGLTETVFSRIVRGRRNPTATERRRIAEALQCSEAALFGTDPNPDSASGNHG